LSGGGHFSEWFAELMRAARASGGARLLVLGEPDDDNPYWAGLRLPPVATLLEAVLRCLLAAPYQRIVVLSGFGRQQLPKRWQLAADLFVGTEAAIWVARGAAKESTPAAETAQPWELPPSALGQPTVLDQQRLLWRSGGNDFQERLKRFGRLIADEARQAQESGRRTALLIDGGFFHPAPGEWKALLLPGQLTTANAASAERAVEIPSNVATSPVDVVLFSEQPSDEQLVTGSGHLLCTLQPRLGREASDDGSLPRLDLGRGFRTLRARRQRVPFPSGFLAMDVSPQDGLYKALRRARVELRPSIAARPEHPDRVDLEFWANFDLERPRRMLEEEVIGQAVAKQKILAALKKLTERCKALWDSNPRAVKTVEGEDPAYLPPVFGLFGAAGMGKTTFCKVLSRSLFGDVNFYQRIDMAGKDLSGQTIGVAPPGAGYDARSPLIRYAERTGGLGLVSIDEFARAQTLSQTLADALGPLLQILQDRSFVPANEAFRPAAGQFHLVNTIFVFAGNVVPSKAECPASFTSLDTLGEAFSQRVRVPIFFEPLQRPDFAHATEVSLQIGARRYAADFAPGQVELAQNAAVTDELRDRILNRFLVAVGDGSPSLRVLGQLVDSVDYGPAFAALRKSGGDRLVLGADLLGGAP
jgi:hypothetical protein